MKNAKLTADKQTVRARVLNAELIDNEKAAEKSAVFCLLLFVCHFLFVIFCLPLFVCHFLFAVFVCLSSRAEYTMLGDCNCWRGISCSEPPANIGSCKGDFGRADPDPT